MQMQSLPDLCMTEWLTRVGVETGFRIGIEMGLFRTGIDTETRFRIGIEMELGIEFFLRLVLRIGLG